MDPWGIANEIWTHLVLITKSASALSPGCSMKKVRKADDNSNTWGKYWRLRIGSSQSDEQMNGV